MQSLLESNSIIAWMQGMKNESGHPIDLRTHLWQYDIFTDMSQIIAGRKSAQAGWTTMEAFKKPYWMNRMGLDGIYTLPTATDANDLSKAKFSRLIANNPKMKALVKEMDTIHQKQIGNQILYIIGTWSTKSAMMHSSDWNTYDELDASDQNVIDQMATRLQHSKYKIEHYFSHPSAPDVGVDKIYQLSDQKLWMVKCERCSAWQNMDWNENMEQSSIVYELDTTLPKKDKNRVKYAEFVCLKCREPLTNEDRRAGNWAKQFQERSISGYQVNLLMNINTSAREIVEYFDTKSPEYFMNKVRGLPYIGDGNKVTWEMVRDSVRREMHPRKDRIIIGLDTGLPNWTHNYYVVGDKNGIFYYGDCASFRVRDDESHDFKEVGELMDEYKNAICIADQGGDTYGVRALQEKYPGRVFLAFYREDKKTKRLMDWGEKAELGQVVIDRNRVIQMVVNEIGNRSLQLWTTGEPEDYYDYFLHWKNIYRKTEENKKGHVISRWLRSGPDHYCHATAYYRVGVDRFGGAASGKVFGEKKKDFAKPGLYIHPDQTVTIKPRNIDDILRANKNRRDWRRT